MNYHAANSKQRNILDDDRADVARAMTAINWFWNDLFEHLAKKLTIAEVDRLSGWMRDIQPAVFVAHKLLDERRENEGHCHS